MLRVDSIRRAACGSVALALALSLGACASPEGPRASGNEGTVAELQGATLMTHGALPTQDPTDLGMDALFRGTVGTDRAGCLRLESGQTAIWPAGYDLAARDGGLSVVNAAGEVVGNVGGEFRLGGGEVATLEGIPVISDEVRSVAEERCPGPYWLVSPGT